MAKLIFGHDEALAQWAEQQYPEGAPFMRPLIAIGIADPSGQELYGVAFYSGHTATNVDFGLITASRRWATKGTVRALLYYPFVQLNLKRMTAFTLKKNRRARKVLEKFGFRPEGVHPYAFPNGGTAMSYGLYREATMERWFK